MPALIFGRWGENHAIGAYLVVSRSGDFKKLRKRGEKGLTMRVMEFRSWVRVRGLDIESDLAADFLDALNEKHGDLGPVLSGAEDGVDVVLATDQDEPVLAAEAMFGAVAECLRAIGRPGLFPTRIEIEPAEDPVLA